MERSAGHADLQIACRVLGGPISCHLEAGWGMGVSESLLPSTSYFMPNTYVINSWEMTAPITHSSSLYCWLH